MIGTIVNTLALLVGTSIGCLVKKGINKRYEAVLFIAMGLAALGIGLENVTKAMPKSHYPVLFIVSLVLGGVCGTALDISGRFDRLVAKAGKSNLGKGLATEILLCCIGALSIVGPVIAAVKGDQTMLFTNECYAGFCNVDGFWRKLRLGDAGCCSRSILLARQHLSRCQIFIGKLFYRSTSNRDFHCGRLLNCLFRVSPVKNS